MYYDFSKPFNLFLDTTTFCNVSCPQCHRTDPNGLGKIGWLPLVSWSYKDVLKMLPPEELKLINRTKLCGTWGDPMMTKDIGKILPYLCDNTIGDVSVDTNGSLRSDDFWWELGIECGSKLRVVFDVDGTTQEMHHKYRQKSDLATVLSNMETFAAAGGIAQSQTIVFNHNHPYKQDIANLCKEHGSQHHEFVVSDRFESVDASRSLYEVTPFKFIDINGNEDELIRAPSNKQPPAFQAVKGKMRLEKRSEEIACEWGMKQEVVINPDGQVFPCCFLANGIYPHTYGEFKDRKAAAAVYDVSDAGGVYHPIMQEYIARKDDFNVNLRPLNEILHDKWYQITLLESIKSATPIKQCVWHCSTQVRKIHQERTDA